MLGPRAGGAVAGNVLWPLRRVCDRNRHSFRRADEWLDYQRPLDLQSALDTSQGTGVDLQLFAELVPTFQACKRAVQQRNHVATVAVTVFEGGEKLVEVLPQLRA